jgi:Domain of unknown function (DUF4389)
MEDNARILVRVDEPLRRRRLAVLFRVLLYLPHGLLVSIWTLLVVPVVPGTWLALLFAGRLRSGLHGFLAAYLRYCGQTTAWLGLLSGRYPDPRHTRKHPFAIEIPEPFPQGRVVTLFRLPLAVPALVLSSVFGVILTLVAVGAWFAALSLGRTTSGMQELGTFCLRYELETLAFLLLLTPASPRLAPRGASSEPG